MIIPDFKSSIYTFLPMRSILTSHKKAKPFSKSRSKKEKRRPWTSKEDDSMRHLVEENGTKQWTVISDKLNKFFPLANRTGKQCRERWHNHLNPGINKEIWSLQEEITLFTYHSKLGNKWAEISNYLPGRTDNSIKNHFYSTLRKQYRSLKGIDSTQDQLKKHSNQLASGILANLQVKWKKQEDLEFVKSQEEFFDSVNQINCSPPDFEDMLDYSECEFMICGQQIDLPPPISPLNVEEAPMEFAWLDGEAFPDEVFLMPLNTFNGEML
jgi:hypothetical protein